MASSFEPTVTLERLRGAMAAFVAERDWEQFHTPRNVLLALVGEVGEVSELFQWRGEVPRGLGASWTEAERTHLGEELSDVLLYLVRLADLCAVDLPSAALRKMRRNAEKYPAERCKGKSDKYTAYAEAAGAGTSPNAKLLVAAARAADGAGEGGARAGSGAAATAAAAAINGAASAAAAADEPPSPAAAGPPAAAGSLALAAAGGAGFALALAIVAGAALALGRRAR